MLEDVLKKLQTVGMLSDHDTDLGHVPTGSYALNRVCSGDFNQGVPVGTMIQFFGESSTGKTVFLSTTLAQAQKLGYYTIFIDSEGTYDKKFARLLGVDDTKLMYQQTFTVEDTFKLMEDAVKEIRALDKDTPIIIAYDSIAASPCKAELDSEDYNQHNMIGGIRAKATGGALRRFNGLLRPQKVTLLVVNQLRSKVGVVYGNPDTKAAGGRSLQYYLGIELQSLAANSERIKGDKGEVIGIRGRIKNTKNKTGLPFREAGFELLYDKGLTPHYGLLELMVDDGMVTQSGAWYTFGDFKFQKKDFLQNFNTDKFKIVRDTLGIIDEQETD